MSKSRIFLFYWFPIALYCFLIYYQSAHPSPEQMPDIPFLDKAMHFGAYAVLGALFLRAFGTLPIKANIRLVMFLSVVLSTLYGISDEIHQHFVPGRHAEMADAIADFLGSIAGVVAYGKLAIKNTLSMPSFLN